MIMLFSLGNLNSFEFFCAGAWSPFLFLGTVYGSDPWVPFFDHGWRISLEECFGLSMCSLDGCLVVYLKKLYVLTLVMLSI